MTLSTSQSHLLLVSLRLALRLQAQMPLTVLAQLKREWQTFTSHTLCWFDYFFAVKQPGSGGLDQITLASAQSRFLSVLRSPKKTKLSVFFFSAALYFNSGVINLARLNICLRSTPSSWAGYCCVK